MSYLIYVGIVVAAGCGLTLLSDGFAYAVSRGVEAGFDFAEHRLALRARARREMHSDARRAQVAAAQFGGGDGATVVALPVNQRSTQQLGVARVAA